MDTRGGLRHGLGEHNAGYGTQRLANRQHDGSSSVMPPVEPISKETFNGSQFSKDNMIALFKAASHDSSTSVKIKEFDGKDMHWATFRTQFRDYAKDKNWLETLSYVVGPTAPVFDHRVNSKIFTPLRNKTSSGAAYTFVNKAPEYERIERIKTTTQAIRHAYRSAEASTQATSLYAQAHSRDEQHVTQ